MKGAWFLGLLLALSLFAGFVHAQEDTPTPTVEPTDTPIPSPTPYVCGTNTTLDVFNNCTVTTPTPYSAPNWCFLMSYFPFLSNYFPPGYCAGSTFEAPCVSTAERSKVSGLPICAGLVETATPSPLYTPIPTATPAPTPSPTPSPTVQPTPVNTRQWVCDRNRCGWLVYN